MTHGWDVRRVYLYLVCLVTLIMVIMGTVLAIRGAVNLLYPYQQIYPNTPYYEAKMRLQREQGVSEQEYRQQLKELEQQIVRERRQSEINERRSRIRGLISDCALIAVALPIFAYHWRKIQRSESTES
ncbi:MAG: hypothetical protein AB1426_01980 [Bacillota bacterium]